MPRPGVSPTPRLFYRLDVALITAGWLVLALPASISNVVSMLRDGWADALPLGVMAIVIAFELIAASIAFLSVVMLDESTLSVRNGVRSIPWR